MTDPLKSLEAEIRALLLRAYEAGRRDGVAALVAAAAAADGQVAPMRPAKGTRVRRADVLGLIRRSGPIEPKQIGALLGIDRSTIYQQIQRLTDLGEIVRVSRGCYEAVSKDGSGSETSEAGQPDKRQRGQS